MLRKKTNDLLEFLRNQRQRVGSVKLLGIKVSLSDKSDVAHKLCEYISQNYMLPYNAHMKSDSKAILSVWYKHLQPCFDSKLNSVGFFAEEVVELFREQKKKQGNIQLLSIKVILPEGVDSDKICNYIVGKYPEYKARSKNQGKYPIVAIGYKE